MSVPVWIEGDDIVIGPYARRPVECEPHLSSDWYGQVRNIDPVIVIPTASSEDAEMIERLFGVVYDYSSNGILRVMADNGTWVYLLEDAHWRDGTPPPWEGRIRFYDDIMIGRWPD